MMFGQKDFPIEYKPGIKLATFDVVNDLEQFISKKDNKILRFFVYMQTKM